MESLYEFNSCHGSVWHDQLPLRADDAALAAMTKQALISAHNAAVPRDQCLKSTWDKRRHAEILAHVRAAIARGVVVRPAPVADPAAAPALAPGMLLVGARCRPDGTGGSTRLYAEVVAQKSPLVWTLQLFDADTVWVPPHGNAYGYSRSRLRAAPSNPAKRELATMHAVEGKDAWQLVSAWGAKSDHYYYETCTWWRWDGPHPAAPGAPAVEWVDASGTTGEAAARVAVCE